VVGHNNERHRAAYYSKGLREVHGMWGYSLRVPYRDDGPRSGAPMSQKLALTALIAVAAAIVGVLLGAAMRPAPEVPSSGAAVASRAEDAPAGAPVPAPLARKAH